MYLVYHQRASPFQDLVLSNHRAPSKVRRAALDDRVEHLVRVGVLVGRSHRLRVGSAIIDLALTLLLFGQRAAASTPAKEVLDVSSLVSYLADGLNKLFDLGVGEKVVLDVLLRLLVGDLEERCELARPKAVDDAEVNELAHVSASRPLDVICSIRFLLIRHSPEDSRSKRSAYYFTTWTSQRCRKCSSREVISMNYRLRLSSGECLIRRNLMEQITSSG